MFGNKLFGTSVFGAATGPTSVIVIPPPEPSISGVSVTPSTVSLVGGQTFQFTATVTGDNPPSQDVTWYVAAGQITPGGLFTTPSDFEGGEITVVATSKDDVTKYGVATVLVSILRSISIKLLNSDGTALSNTENLRWAWFDQTTPDQFSVPTDTGFGVFPDEFGNVQLTLEKSSLLTGQVGWLVITDSSGDVEMPHRAFSGPVAVN